MIRFFISKVRQRQAMSIFMLIVLVGALGFSADIRAEVTADPVIQKANLLDIAPNCLRPSVSKRKRKTRWHVSKTGKS
jgi:hypothetical protein